MKKVKKMLTLVLAVVLVLCSASTVSAWVSISITPDIQYTCPQISEFWTGSPPCDVCHIDKTVTYTVTVETDSPPVSVAVFPGETPDSWFSWLDSTLPYPYTAGSFPLDIKVPLTLGKDAGGEYIFAVSAVDSWGSSAQATATLVVQDHDYVTETLIAGTGDVTTNEKIRNMAIATNVDKTIDFHGTVDCLTKNEYLMVDAKGGNANFEQEAVVSEYRAILPTDYLYGNERFKSCAVMGGTGADIHEEYVFDWVESRCENINHHVTGDQKRKTELCTYNRFNGTLLIDARQSVPCSILREDRQIATGNLTVGKHIIFRRP